MMLKFLSLTFVFDAEFASTSRGTNSGSAHNAWGNLTGIHGCVEPRGISSPLPPTTRTLPPNSTSPLCDPCPAVAGGCHNCQHDSLLCECERHAGHLAQSIILSCNAARVDLLWHTPAVRYTGPPGVTDPPAGVENRSSVFPQQCCHQHFD